MCPDTSECKTESLEDGKTSSEAGSGSAGAAGNGSGAEGTASACADGAGSLDGSVGSDQGGNATSWMDSCACPARTSARKIAAADAGVLPVIRWAISAAVAATVRVKSGAKRLRYG